ncbi:hypothetical protein [Tunicatimonas pelagia]|uniref:hypothetical protein n=1 Tax=Tunicatimonas pelagia TaxID=931531 RepID=UPI002665D0C4|nr:hypothetical protein [Tunicatimonas pelagia]WKN43412.1 hypothetical protein P0M28_00310 [Tunicatimonas pelagia]
MKVSKLNQEELLVQVDVAVQAALTVSELTNAFQSGGFDPDKIKVGLTLAKEVTDWQDRQTATANNVRVTQRAYRTAKEMINSLYFRHLEAARFMYRDDEPMKYTLQLPGPRQTRFAAWFEQVRSFYTNVDPKALGPFGVQAKEINEVKKLLDQLSELQVLRNDARRQAQQSTRGKQLAINDLRTWFRRFIDAAKFVCHDDPQLLESMGIVIPSNS